MTELIKSIWYCSPIFRDKLRWESFQRLHGVIERVMSVLTTEYLTFSGYPMCHTIQYTTYSCGFGICCRCSFVSVEGRIFGVSPGS